MYNAHPFNGAVFNEFSPSTIIQVTDDIIFDWYWLKNASIVPSDSDSDNLPDIEINTFLNPMFDWWGVVERRFKNKDYTIRGVLRANSAEELEALMDEFKYRMVTPVNWLLKIKNPLWYRVTYATLANQNIFDRKHYHITFVPYTLVFRSMDPFQTDEWYQSKSFLGMNTDFSLDINNNGRRQTLPRFIFIFSNPTTAFGLTLSIWNNSITITTSISQLAIIDIDCENFTVKKNNVAVPYSWTLPHLKVWTNITDITITWTKTYDLTVLYKRVYN